MSTESTHEATGHLVPKRYCDRGLIAGKRLRGPGERGPLGALPGQALSGSPDEGAEGQWNAVGRP